MQDEPNTPIAGWYRLDAPVPGLTPGYLIQIVPHETWSPGRFLLIRYPDRALRLRYALERDGGRWLRSETTDETPYDETRHVIVARVAAEYRDHDA